MTDAGSQASTVLLNWLCYLLTKSTMILVSQASREYLRSNHKDLKEDFNVYEQALNRPAPLTS